MESLQKLASQLIDAVSSLTTPLPSSEKERNLEFLIGVIKSSPKLPYPMLKKIFFGSLSLLIEKGDIESLELKVKLVWGCFLERLEYRDLMMEFLKEEMRIGILIIGKNLEGIRKGDENIKAVSIGKLREQ